MSTDHLPKRHKHAGHPGEDDALQGADGDTLKTGMDDVDQDAAPSGVPAWFISTAVHGLLALFFWAVVFAVREKPVELPPMRVSQIDAPAKQEVKKEHFEDKTQIQVAIKEADIVAPINQLNLVTEIKPASEDDTQAQMNKGRKEAVADSEMASNGAFMTIGANGGGAGLKGLRTGGGKHRALIGGGGSDETESRVEAALQWFKRHQSPNGAWDVEKYPANCTDGQKCEPGSTANGGGSDENVAMTGYALLCFLGAGYDHKTPTKFRNVVAKGLEYLRSAQKADGLFGMRNYENAVATMALSEAYAMTNDPELKTPAQNGVKVILARQAKDAKANDAQYAGLGWNYIDPDPSRNDSSVTGWNVMALKSAVAAELQVGNGMAGAKNWLLRAWKATNKDWDKISDPYNSMSTFPYTWNANTDAVDVGAPGAASKDMAPVGALCAVFLGHHAGDMMLESLCNHIMKYQLPTAYPCNTYYLYYNTMAIFQAGGNRWKIWNEMMKNTLLKAQRQGDGCFDGSWDWANTIFPGSDSGRVLSTAYCCLCLEVYYRYRKVGAGAEPVAAPHP